MQKKNDWKYKCYILIVLVISFFIFFIFLYYNERIKIAHTIRDAKNIQLAMRMVAIEYYGVGRNLFISGTPYGMENDAIEEIRFLSQTQGEITLISWDSKKNIPEKFYYQTDSYLVIYRYESSEEKFLWDIYRLYPKARLGYGSKKNM